MTSPAGDILLPDEVEPCPGSDVELPDMCPSESEDEAAPNEPAHAWTGLPSDLCCKHNCCEQLGLPDFQAARACWSKSLASMRLHEKKQAFVQLLSDTHNKPVGVPERFLFCGYWFCSKIWRQETTCGASTHKDFMRQLRAGFQHVPVDGRTCREHRDKPCSEHVDAWMLQVYQTLAEPLADVQVETDVAIIKFLETMYKEEVNEWAAVVDPRSDALTLASHVQTGTRGIEKRWLPPMTVQQLYELYLSHANGHHDEAKKTVFFNVWQRTWRKIMPLRPKTKHIPCPDCARYSKERKDAVLEEEKAQITVAFNRHLQSIFVDRNVLTRIENGSEANAKGLAVGLGMDTLYIAIDGMDMAKFVCPRYKLAPKQFSELWRPALHFTGAIIGGVAELFVVEDSDAPKGANAMVTVLFRSIELASEKYESLGRPVPEHLVIQLDNTASQNRNTTAKCVASVLVATGRFRSAMFVCFGSLLLSWHVMF